MATTTRWLQEAGRRHGAGDLDGAEALCRRVLRRAPGHAGALHLLGLVRLQRGDWAGAVPALERAVAAAGGQAGPSLAGPLNDLALALQGAGRLEEARDACLRAADAQPEYPQAWYTRGGIERARGDWPAAQACLARAAALRPDWPEAVGLLGTLLNNRGFPEEGLPHLERAVALGAAAPEDRLTLRGNLGVCLAALGRRAEARACHERVLAEDPARMEAHLNLGLLLLAGGDGPGGDGPGGDGPGGSGAGGDMARGWEEYEWRLQTPQARRRAGDRPRWDGAPLAGRTLLVHAEQGYGDTFQLVRYLPLIPRHGGGRVVFECQPGTRALLAACAGFDEIIERPASNLPGDRAAHDVQIPLASLPRLFPHPAEAPPGRAPYLQAPPARAAAWGELLARLCAGRAGHGPDDLKVGLVWAGNPEHVGDHSRSAALADFAPLGSIPGVTLFGLQVGPAQAQAADPPAGMTLVDLAPRLADFVETAAALQGLDLLVAVDTSVVHLAGALGRPAWLLLPFAPDFRWLLGREDSPWYPTLRLFRQPGLRDWASVLGRVAAEVRTLAAARAALRRETEAAEALYAAGDAAGALERLRGLAARHPAHPRAWNDLGVIHWGRGETVPALEAFQRALEAAPHDPAARRNCADALAALEPAKRAA